MSTIALTKTASEMFGLRVGQSVSKMFSDTRKKFTIIEFSRSGLTLNAVLRANDGSEIQWPCGMLAAA